MVVCRSVVPPDNSDSIYSCAVENASQSSLDSVATLATPLTNRSQVNAVDSTHVNQSTRRLPRHGSRPSSTVRLPTDQSFLHPYSYLIESRSSQNLRDLMLNLGTYTHGNPSSHQLPRLRPIPCTSFDSGSLTVVAQPLPPVVLHDGPDIAVPGDVATLMTAYPLFWPIAPEQVQRYERELVEAKETDFWIDPLTTSFQTDTVPDEWVAYVHPEGARYFVRKRKIFTDINLYDSDQLELITKFMVDMEDYIRAKGINIYPNVDLVFDLRRNPEDGNIYYTTNYPYGVPDLQQILALTNSIKETVLSGSSHSPSSVSSTSRFMFIFVQQRFYNFHGLPAARLECDKSVYGTETKRTPLVILLSPLLFSAPDIYLASLNKIWGDGLVTKTSWTVFIEKLKAEWQDLILNSVDDSSAKDGRSLAQILSYISIIASIGSIILGLLLTRKSRWMLCGATTEAWTFLHSRKQHYTGLERLAIMYSLPYALLMWAMVTFLSAFILMCFTGSDVDVRILVGTACLAIAVLVFWCITASWESKQSDHRWYILLSELGTKVWRRLSSAHVLEKIKILSWSKTRHSVHSDETVVGV
ncbi:hypothetical protein ARMSODRAFT_1039908 [Armillaria solidipes]|uniref:WW domain-containing protein n=1 Tax=Armillaria solidipes TaxID=1076256 RepID=A0A2H3BJ74_9AGAR|nr:hypothetical protein ARMSODRAFT_1039908 [Armillaria solidipes]